MSFKKHLSIPFFSILFFTASLLLSQNILASRPYEGPISAAMGGSGRAAVIPGEIFLNPASLSYVAGYQLVANYRNFGLDPYGNITDYKFSILDNHGENIFPAAISYEKHRTWQNNLGANEDAVNVAIAKTAIGRLSVGFDIERYSITPDLGSATVEWDTSVGMIYPFTPNWGVGIVGYNLIPTNSTALIAKYAAAVAYYYRFEAPEAAKKDSINKDDLQESTRKAGRW